MQTNELQFFFSTIISRTTPFSKYLQIFLPSQKDYIS